MMDMVERVARAILKRRFYDGEEKFYDGLDGFWSEIKGGQLDDAKAEARAAIEAMREPTEDMIYVGEGYCDFMLPSTHDNSGDGRRKEFRMGWQAAIDHALTPSPASK